MMCAPWWRYYPVCPKCERKVAMTKRKAIVRCSNKECELAGAHLHAPLEG